MGARLLSLILPLLLTPALAACGKSGPQPPAPLTESALSAVARDSGAPREKLARAIDDMFADSEAGETRAVVVMRGGRIVAERYAPGYGKDKRLIGWSMSKTITGVMIGMLVADGRLRLDESVPVPAWQRTGDPRGEITLRQLLQMRSGLRHTESGDPVYQSDEVRMLFLDGRNDMAAYAEAQPLEAEPGRKFEYSSATTVILADAAARVLTTGSDPAVRRAAVADYLRTRLFEPVGLRSMVAEYDTAGTMVGSSLIHGTARDWAAFGEFLRNKGSVRGAQIVPRDWIDFMTGPSPRNPGYGAQIWLNRPQADGKEVLFPDRAARDIFACVGHLGQYVVVSPTQKLVVVRLGNSDEEQRVRVRAGLARIVELFPRS
ncbi:MAG: serine hydrolase domain-containing protein [Novosphingobium sp.]